MAPPYFPSPSERETFDIARAKARDAAELERIEAIYALLVELGVQSERSIQEIRDAKARRGEKVRPLTRSEKEFVDDLATDDQGLHPAIRKDLEKQASAREVLQGVAQVHCYDLRSSRDMLRYYEHPEERAIEERLIALKERLAEALFAFIDDAKFRSRAEREAADSSLRTGSGSALYVLLDVQNERDTGTNGKELGRAFEKLETWAEELGVKKPSAFFGFGERGSGDWFAPGEGLATFEALSAHVAKASTRVKAKKALLADLREATEVLRYAGERGASFHIEIDI
jgi:hypothetical protein